MQPNNNRTVIVQHAHVFAKGIWASANRSSCCICLFGVAILKMICNGYLTSCENYICLCSGYLTSCRSCLMSCKSHLMLCNPYLTSCGSYLRLCNRYLTTCKSYLRLCNGYLTSCESYLTSCCDACSSSGSVCLADCFSRVLGIAMTGNPCNPSQSVKSLKKKQL